MGKLIPSVLAPSIVEGVGILMIFVVEGGLVVSAIREKKGLEMMVQLWSSLGL